jgi:hypothetical protein
MVQGLGLAAVNQRAVQHPDARAALRAVLRWGVRQALWMGTRADM